MNVAFVVAAADYGNIGDALIRRRAIAWLSDYDELNVYVGSGGDEWVEALKLPSTARIWRRPELVGWALALLSGSGRTFLFDPGEISLRRGSRFREALFLLLTLLVRLRGGRIARHARHLVGSDPAALWLHRMSCRLSQSVSWRTHASRGVMNIGDTVPDLAFWEHVELNHGGSRRSLVVSLRGDRPLPNRTWVNAVTEFAAEAHLRIVCVAQVRADIERTEELSRLLSCDAVLFDDRDLLRQEALLRSLYGRAQLVLSDRFHVLVLAALHGAAPLELVPSPSKKVTEHFATIGLDRVSCDSAKLPKAELKMSMEAAIAPARLIDIRSCLDSAHSGVGAVVASVEPREKR